MFVVLLIIFLGFMFGCLANVCIYTMPRDIPFFNANYHKFSFYKKYPLVIVINIILFLLMYFYVNNIYILPIYLFLVFCLVVLTVIDLQFQIIPDEFSILLIIIGLSTSFANSYLADTVVKRVIESFLGFFVGGGTFLLVAILGKMFFKKEILGGGDIKLMAAIGPFIGWQKVLFAIFIASLLGSVVGFILLLCKKISKHEAIPFAPYITTGSILTFILPTPATIMNFISILENKYIVKYLIG